MSTTDPAATGDHTPLADQHVLVVGLGTSGRAATTALLEAGLSVTAVDQQPVEEARRAMGRLGATVAVETRPEEHLDGIDLVVLSPGVPASAPVVEAAAARELPVWSEPELAWRLCGGRPLVGITGTNGKTSVTELTAAMLTASGRQAMACGNIGMPLITAARQAPAGTILVTELSSFQLRFCYRLRPRVGVLLNLAADHLDWHGDAAAYARAKARLWRAQGPADWAVVNADDDATTALAAEHAPGGLARFSGRRAVEPPAVAIVDGRLVADLPGVSGSGPLLAVGELTMDAAHHRANVAAAATAALLAGARREGVAAAARGWRPGDHRLQTVAERGGVRWVDDSKATNPHAVAAALAAVGTASSATVWIAGGTAKGVDLDVLADHLGTVRHAVLLGEAADVLAAVCSRREVPTTRVGSMAEAVAAAAERARPGETVLLAPACASFDMFEDYADRGRQFAAAVQELEVEVRG